MKTIFATILTVALLSSSAFSHCGKCGAEDHQDSATKTSATIEVKSILETAKSAEKFTTLITAIKAAGLTEALNGEGPFTVFAPTDEAFAKLPKGTVEALLNDKEKLTAILTYHVVDGFVKANDVVGLDKATTLNGKTVSIKVENEKVMVGNAMVVATDILCSNGVIHIIDTVLLP